MKYLLEVLLQNSFAIHAFWILAFLSLVGISLECRQRLNLDAATGMLLASLGVLNGLYWGAYFNYHAFQLVFIVSGIALLIRRRHMVLREGMAYLSLLSVVLWFALMSVNTIPFSWDEYFWTLFDQHIANYSSYWNTESGILLTHIRYMPGASLWHNYFGIKGYYDPATAYFAISVICILAIFWFIHLAQRSNRIFLLFSISLTFGCFSEGWLLYVDPLLGILMAIFLVSGVRYLRGDTKSFYALALSISSAVLLKETGVIPALSTVIVIGALTLRVGKSAADCKKLAAVVVYCLFLLIVWKYYQAMIGASSPVQWSLFVDNSPASVDFRNHVYAGFFNYITSSYTMLLVWFVAALSLVELLRSGGNRIEIIFVLTTVLAYIAIHLFAWLYFVGDILAGAARYMGSLLIALFVFYTVRVAEQGTLKLTRKLLLIAILAWVPVNIVLSGHKPSALFMLLNPHPKQVPIAREQLTRMANIVPSELLALCRKQPTRVWFIHQGSNGYEAMQGRHVMFPCQVSPGSFSVGARYGDDDIWTADYSKKQFLEMAELYPYIFFSRVDSNFTDKYAYLFDDIPRDGDVFKFNVDANIFNRMLW